MRLPQSGCGRIQTSNPTYHRMDVPTHRRRPPCSSTRVTDHPGVSMTPRKLARELRDHPATVSICTDLDRDLRGHDLS